MYNHIIFDLDGTLVDTIQDVTNSINHALESMGFPVKTKADVKQAIGPGREYFLQYIFPEGEHTQINGEQFLELFRNHYWDHCIDETRLFQGMEKVLEILKDKRLHVASNKPKKYIIHILNGLEIKDKFDIILGPEDVTAVKPHPEMIVQLLQKAGAQASEALFVGDTDNDMQAGRGAGVHLCAVKFGYGNQKVLKTYNPEYFIKRPEEIIDIVMNHTTQGEAIYGS